MPQEYVLAAVITQRDVAHEGPPYGGHPVVLLQTAPCRRAAHYNAVPAARTPPGQADQDPSLMSRCVHDSPIT